MHLYRRRSHGALTLRDDVPCVNYAWDPSQDPEKDVDAEIRSKATFKCDGQRWNEEGDEVEADVIT